MIRRGLAALRLMQYEVLADDVTYSRDGAAKAVKAIVGRTVFRSTNDSGHWTRTETRDFIIRPDELGLIPEKGDVIRFDGGEYEVLAPNGEPVECAEEPVAVFRNRFEGKVRSAKRGERRSVAKPPARYNAEPVTSFKVEKDLVL